MDYVRVNVMLEQKDVKYLQKLEAATGKNRSELIREAVRAYRPPRHRQVDTEMVLKLLDFVRVDLSADPVTMVRAMREGIREG